MQDDYEEARRLLRRKPFSQLEPPPPPEPIHTYQEGKYTVRVFPPRWAEGAKRVGILG